MPTIKYIHVLADSKAVPAYRHLRDIIWGFKSLDWKCQSVYVGDDKATAWLVNADVQPPASADD